MTRELILAGYALVALAAVAYEVVARVGRRAPTLDQAVGLLTRSLVGRAAVLALWLWAGWHVFVRSGSPG